MAKTSELTLTVITPERQVLDEPATSVVLPAHDGEIGILRGRAPLMAELGIGQLRYTKGGQVRRVFIDGGFTQVIDNRVTVLTPRAIPAADITAEQIDTAQKQATRPDARGTERAAAQRRVTVLKALQSLR